VYVEILALARAKHGSFSLEAAEIQANLGALLSIEHRNAEAQVELEESLKVLTQLHGQSHPSVGAVLESLGSTFGNIGNLTGALECFQKSLHIRKLSLGEEHPAVLQQLANLGHLYGRMGNLDRQRHMYRLALASNPNPELRSNVLGCLATLYSVLNRLEDAHQMLDQAVALKRQWFSGNLQSLATSLNALGAVLRKLGRFAEAKHVHEEALGMSTTAAACAACNQNLGLVALAENNFVQALAFFEDSERNLHPNDPDLGGTWSNMGVALASLGRHQEALERFKNALERQQGIFGPLHLSVARTLVNIGKCLLEEDRVIDAERCFASALSKFKLELPSSHPTILMLEDLIGGMGSSVNADDGESVENLVDSDSDDGFE
jgi:tetratricopeptide (TPR) repeat protein